MKIFVVVGTQEPFDRMVKTIDLWARNNSTHSVFAQISRTEYKPESIGFTDFISPELFDQHFNEADLIVSHAGMGTIISALRHSKPIIVMPRLASMHEHRNDHQLATAKSFEKLGYVQAVYSKEELFKALDSAERIEPAAKIGTGASTGLINTIKNFIDKS
jgi:UDP-N-acetylglucosamine transferase subunit ALG13